MRTIDFAVSKIIFTSNWPLVMYNKTILPIGPEESGCQITSWEEILDPATRRDVRKSGPCVWSTQRGYRGLHRSYHLELWRGNYTLYCFWVGVSFWYLSWRHKYRSSYIPHEQISHRSTCKLVFHITNISSIKFSYSISQMYFFHRVSQM